MAANPHRGEVEFVVEGERYVLRYATNSIAAAEEATDSRMAEIAGRLIRNVAGIGDIRWLVWSGLLHERPEFTLEQAGDLIDTVGMTKMLEPVNNALALMMAPPDPTPAAPATKTSKASATGRKSSRRRS